MKKNNIIIGIVTLNSLHLVKNLLVKTQIDINIFDIIITSDDASATKPSLDLYLAALKKLNVDKEQVIAIEDSNVGIISAVTTGIRVINVTDIDNVTNENKKKCYVTVKSLDNIINIFKEKRILNEYY